MILLIFCVYLPQMPFSIKNYNITGKWTGPSTAGDIVVGIGNNPDAPPGTMDIPEPHYIQYDNFDEFTYWRKLDSEGQKPLKDSIKGWILGNPLQWLELKFRTLSLYLSNESCYNNITLVQQSGKGKVTWLNSFFLFDFWVVGIPFLVLFLRMLVKRNFKNRQVNLTMTVIVVYIGSIVIFYVLNRYKLPVIPLMAAVAGAEFVRWKHVLTGDRKNRKILVAALLIFSTFFIARWYDIYNSMQPAVMKSLTANGNQFETSDAIYIKDHPMQTRGGWDYVEVEKSILMRKTFAVEKTVSSKGTLRLLIYGIKGGIANIRIRHAGRKPIIKHSFKKEGWEWVEIPIEKIVSQNGEIEFEIEIFTDKTIAVQYSGQRNFGRSMFNGQPLAAEWVIQLRVEKENTKEN